MAQIPTLFARVTLAGALLTLGCSRDVPDIAAQLAGTYTDPATPGSRIVIAFYPDGHFTWDANKPDSVHVIGSYSSRADVRTVTLQDTSRGVAPFKGAALRWGSDWVTIAGDGPMSRPSGKLVRVR